MTKPTSPNKIPFDPYYKYPFTGHCHLELLELHDVPPLQYLKTFLLVKCFPGAALWPVIQGGGNHIKAPQCIAFEENVLVKPYKSTALLNWISSLETMAIKPTVGAVWGNV